MIQLNAGFNFVQPWACPDASWVHVARNKVLRIYKPMDISSRTFQWIVFSDSFRVYHDRNLPE